MAARFASNLILLLAAALLASLRFTFPGAALIWLAFGLGGFAVLVVAAAFAVRGRGTLQRVLDLCTVTLGAWTVVSALTLSHGTVGWLALAEGAGLGMLSVAGLLAHEATLETAIVSARGAVADGVDAAGRWPGAVERQAS